LPVDLKVEIGIIQTEIPVLSLDLFNRGEKWKKNHHGVFPLN